MTSTSLLVVLSCFFWTSKSQTDKIFPPENLTLTWNYDFKVELTWTPPAQHAKENCTYEAVLGNGSKTCKKVSPPWECCGDEIKGRQSSVRTVCNGMTSTWVTINELVTNVFCKLTSSTLAQCSWQVQPDSPADLSFYYELEDNSGAEKPSKGMQKCAQNPNTSAGLGRCDIQQELHDAVYLVFNGTVDNKTVRNIFKKWPKRNVRHPPLKWTATTTMHNFTLHWTPPQIGNLSSWEFYINYSFCDQTDTKKVHGNDTCVLPRKPECETCISISGNITKESCSGWTDHSDRKCFAPETNMLVYAAIIVPLLFACLAVMVIVCCRKNKDIIFPKIPEPRDFLSDISNNNNKGIIHSHYIPAEEQDCKITLVTDPQNNKL